VSPEKGTSKTIAKQSHTAKSTFAMNQEKERKKKDGERKKTNSRKEGRKEGHRYLTLFFNSRAANIPTLAIAVVSVPSVPLFFLLFLLLHLISK
jgi:hypothetical protein